MVKQGYKQTEIGIIPEDWRCAKIEDIATISMCKRIFAGQTTENGEIPFYKIGTFGKEADSYISRVLYNEYRNRFSFPQKGDVLISAAGTLGRTVVYNGKDAYFQDSNIVWLDIDKTTLCNEYLNHYYCIIKWASSEGSTIARLYNGIIYATNIALPPLDEQKHIAKALSDVDGMISSLEKLIAKKKAIKQGAMQELLSGKKRLSGFTGEWRKIALKELINEFIVPMRDKPKDLNGPIPWCRIEDFNGKYLCSSKSNQGVTVETINNMNLKVFPKNTLLVSCSAYLGRCAIVKSELVTNQTFIGLVPGDNINVDFLFYVMNGEEKNLNLLSSGTTISYLSREQFEDYKIYIPCDGSEQTAIASILSDMDNEIDALVKKLAKTRKIKQGMIQQLLTGKIRLI